MKIIIVLIMIKNNPINNNDSNNNNNLNNSHLNNSYNLKNNNNLQDIGTHCFSSLLLRTMNSTTCSSLSTAAQL